MQHYYRFGSEVVACDDHLPALQPTCPPGRGSSIKISVRRADVGRRPIASDPGRAVKQPDASFALRFSEQVEYLVTQSLSEITCVVDHGASLDEMHRELLDHVLPRVLAGRGRFMLHASGVLHATGALLFVGPSGAGKSTLAASFLERGLTLLGDDCFEVSVTGTQVHAISCYPSLRLHQDSYSRLFPSPRLGFAEAGNGAKVRLDSAAEDQVRSPVPVRWIYELNTTNGRATVSPMSGREAMMSLLGQTFQLHTDAVVMGQSLTLAARVSTSVVVRRLSYQRDFGQIADVHDAVLASIR